MEEEKEPVWFKPYATIVFGGLLLYTIWNQTWLTTGVPVLMFLAVMGCQVLAKRHGFELRKRAVPLAILAMVVVYIGSFMFSPSHTQFALISAAAGALTLLAVGLKRVSDKTEGI